MCKAHKQADIILSDGKNMTSTHMIHRKGSIITSVKLILNSQQIVIKIEKWTTKWHRYVSCNEGCSWTIFWLLSGYFLATFWLLYGYFLATFHYGYFPLWLLPIMATSHYGYFPLRLLLIPTTQICYFFHCVRETKGVIQKCTLYQVQIAIFHFRRLWWQYGNVTLRDFHLCCCVFFPDEMHRFKHVGM